MRDMRTIVPRKKDRLIHVETALGIVNIWVGFAPLKPAEVVILYLQQMAGQIET